jgi:hypothetical protein
VAPVGPESSPHPTIKKALMTNIDRVIILAFIDIPSSRKFLSFF